MPKKEVKTTDEPQKEVDPNKGLDDQFKNEKGGVIVSKKDREDDDFYK